MKRHFALLLALLMSLALLVSCNTPDEPPVDEQPPADDPVITDGISLLNDDGTAKYVLIRPSYLDGKVASAAIALRKAVNETWADAKMTIGEDWAEESDWPAINAAYEILVGETNRPETAEVLNSLEPDTYAIRLVGADGLKLVIVGTSDELTIDAIYYFMENYLTTASGEKTHLLPRELSYVGKKAASSYTGVKPLMGSGAVLIQPRHEAEDVIVANIVATEEPYNADPTGRTDSTKAIRQALADLDKRGGGTVYLPAGQYLVTQTIQVPGSCELRGDWQDPDEDGELTYGTVILVKTRALTTEQLARSPYAYPAFDIGGHAAMVGLTFYYPDQDINNVKCYGYTIYGANTSAYLRNLTFINSYRAICAGGGELGHIGSGRVSNIRGCALDIGCEMDWAYDVYFTTDFKLSPDYWIEAGSGYACSDAATLRSYCKQNLTGLLLYRVDDLHFTNVSIDTAKTAVRLTNNPSSGGSPWGVFYGLEVSNSYNGVMIENLASAHGMLFAHATIEADNYAIRNEAVGDTGVKLCDIKLTGKGGITTKKNALTTIEDYELIDNEISERNYKKPTENLYIPNLSGLSRTTEDASPAIQTALDAAAKTGGVVYIPAGIYSLYDTLNVPAGVELRGARNSTYRQTTAYGTSLISYVEGTTIELGEYAGVTGMILHSPLYTPDRALELSRANDAAVTEHIGVRGLGKGVYVQSLCSVGFFTAIDFTDCDGHVIRAAMGNAYNDYARVGGKGGAVSQILCNIHFLHGLQYAQSGLYNEDYVSGEAWNAYAGEDQSSEEYFTFVICLMRAYSTLVHAVDAEDELVSDVFYYSTGTLVECDNSTATLLNNSSDMQGFNSAYRAVNGSEVYAANLLHIYGNTFYCDDTSSLELYNRTALDVFHLPSVLTWLQDNSDESSREISHKVVLGGESMSGVSGVTLNREQNYVKEGNASYKFTPPAPHTALGLITTSAQILEMKFDKTDISDCMTQDGYLHMWVYVDDLTTFDAYSGAIELTSSGKCDVAELSWTLRSYVTREGWNEVFLPLCDRQRVGYLNNTASAGFDPTGVNYIRIWQKATRGFPTIYIDDIYVCRAPFVGEDMEIMQ